MLYLFQTNINKLFESCFKLFLNMSYAYFHKMIIMGHDMRSHDEMCNGKDITQCGDKYQKQKQKLIIKLLTKLYEYLMLRH